MRKRHAQTEELAIAFVIMANFFLNTCGGHGAHPTWMARQGHEAGAELNG